MDIAEKSYTNARYDQLIILVKKDSMTYECMQHLEKKSRIKYDSNHHLYLF